MKFVNLEILKFVLLFACFSLFDQLKLMKKREEIPKLITPDHQALILRLHNKIRNDVALGKSKNKLPFAKNMLQLYWNNDIASKAQKWADKKKYISSKRKYRSFPFFKTGENLFETVSKGTFGEMDWELVINTWANEIDLIKPEAIDNYQVTDPTTGHGAQLIWANTIHIGCGFTQFIDGDNYYNLYVCHYGPVGNIIGHPIYRKSSTLRCGCPTGSDCDNETMKGICCPKGSCFHHIYGGALPNATSPELVEQEEVKPSKKSKAL
jgi:hypothetical protein